VKYKCFENPTYKNIENKEGQKIFFKKDGLFYD
jgi:hypothetical protein